VTINLLGNAIKYSSKKDKPEISVSCEQNDGEYSFCIKDNGAGFNMAHSDKLYVAFQRLHSMSDFEGIGIGLALVSNIVKKHGGRVWAESIVNEGASFYFVLPIRIFEV
jgi:two-component system, sensor histidine kinase and response regulator